MKTLNPPRCSRMLRVLADPQRLRIVQCLRGGAKNVSDLAACLDRHIVKVSHHLSVLRRAGLVEGIREGRFVVYRLRPEIHATKDDGAGPEYLDLGCCRLEM